MKDIIIGFVKDNKRWIIAISLLFILIIAIAGFSYVLKLIDTSNPNNSSFWGAKSSTVKNNMNAQVENKVTSQISTRNIVSKGNGDYKLDIDLDAKVDEIYAELSKTESGRRVLNRMTGSEKEKKELLKDMIRAELITQYPDLRSKEHMGQDVESDEIQGVIRFKRVLSDSIKEVKSIKKSENTSIELNGGVVCWGDDFTLGNTEDSSDSYPAKLSEKLKKNVYNLGFSGATSAEIALMAGAEGYSFETSGEEFTIGAELNSEVTFSAKIKYGGVYRTSIPFKSFDGSSENKKLKCTIGGAQGEITYKDGNYVFKRTVEGTEEKISPETEIVLEKQSGYTSSFPIIWIGNGNSRIDVNNKGSIKRIVEDCNAIINMSDDPDNYLVILPTHYTDENGQLQKYDSTEYEAIKNVFMNESGINTKLIVDLWDKINNGYEYDEIVNIIVEKLKENNVNIGGEYNQNVDPNDIIEFGAGTISAGTTIDLEYIPLGNKLEPEPGTLMWLINNEDDEIKKVSLQYFSIDANGNIIIANWSRVTTTLDNQTDGDGGRDNYQYDEGYPTVEVVYTANAVKVNYRNSISEYTMPFDYLWTLLVMGDDTEFVRNLTNLALDSKIEATLFDELTVVENDVVDEYTTAYNEHITYDKTRWEYDYMEEIDNYRVLEKGKWKEQYDITPTPGQIDTKHRTNVVTETNKVKYRLTYADIWSQTYKVDGIEQVHYDGHEQDSVTIENGSEYQVEKKENFTIKSQRNTDIYATSIVPVGCDNAPLVVLCHGFTGAKEGDDNHFIKIGENLAKSGIAAIMIDFPGCGKSQEPSANYTLTNMENDINSAVQYMKNTYKINENQIGVAGHSMGGRVASEYLDNSGVSVAVLLAPANGDGLDGLEFLADSHDTNTLIEGSKRWNFEVSETFINEMAASHPQDKIKNFVSGGGKIFVAYGTEDNVISSKTQEAVKAAVPSDSYHIYQGGDHNLAQYSSNSEVTTKIVEDVSKFLCESFGKSMSASSTEFNDLYQQDIQTFPNENWITYNTVYPPSPNEEFEGGYVSVHKTVDYQKRVINHAITTTIIKSGYTYTEGRTSVKEKTDKNYTEEEMETGNFAEPNFVKYYIYSSTARNSISSTYSWLFEALENNQRTEGLVQITKYMIYKATDNDLGVTSFDFSVYNETDFKDATDYDPVTDGGVIGAGGDGSLSGDSGDHYWGVYVRGDKEYKCYYQNSYSGTFKNSGCVATAAAIAHSGYGSTKTPMDYWDGSQAINCGITKISRNKSTIISYLNQNVPVIIYNAFNGDFNGGSLGHAIVLVDINANGEVYVINPYHSGAQNEGWQSLDKLLSYAPGTGAPNTMGSAGVGIVTN